MTMLNFTLKEDVARCHAAAMYKQALRSKREAIHAKQAIVSFFERVVFIDDVILPTKLFEGLAEFANDHAGPYVALRHHVRPTVSDLSCKLMESLGCRNPLDAVKEALDDFFWVTIQAADDEIEEHAEE